VPENHLTAILKIKSQYLILPFFAHILRDASKLIFENKYQNIVLFVLDNFSI